MSEYVKIYFENLRDEEDASWPPDSVESMWATPTGNNAYRLENVPAFVRGIAFGDTVEAMQNPAGESIFTRVLSRGGHSTIRILFGTESDEKILTFLNAFPQLARFTRSATLTYGR